MIKFEITSLMNNWKIKCGEGVSERELERVKLGWKYVIFYSWNSPRVFIQLLDDVQLLNKIKIENSKM